MSLELLAAIDNAEEALASVLPAYASGRVAAPDLPHGIGLQFRQLGTCRTLHQGVPEPLFAAQMQSASSYIFGLRLQPQSQQVTSFAGCFWDAVAGGYWIAAEVIARETRKTVNPDREHEDDFLYVWFLMECYFLQPDQGHEHLLARWEEVLDGGTDPKLDLCRALVSQDAEAFQDALLTMAEQRVWTLKEKLSGGKIDAEQALWVVPVWPEGLALLRLAERKGIPTEFDCPMAPALLRVPQIYCYNPDAFRTLDYEPARL
jgi:hypothetical protein